MSTEIVRAAEALVAVCEEAFEQHFIFDHEVRLAVCTRLLESGELIDQVGSGYDLLSLVNGDTIKTVDPYKSSRTSVTVSVGLTAQERAELVAANPDVDLVFKDGMTMPHAKANALRSIHRKKALSLVAHHRGTVLDIGGNYLQAALGAGSRNYNIHNCTLLAGETEHHRQVQRDVAIEVSSLDAPDYCTAGAENCTVQASQGVCIHALTCIDPGLWPEIFQRHGLEYVVCYFHYDPAMEVDDVGFMPVPGMHWVRKGDIIECHFDNDSSHPYVHNREWMLRYGSSWTATLPDWDYLVYYEVEHIKDGVAKASFTRMDKRTLGPEDDMCQYRLLDYDDCVDLDVPEFDPTLGRSIKDPRAYTISSVRVTLPLFSHVYRLGISNDTSRPDLPLTFDAIRDQCHAFNHVRRVNGTSLTVPYRLGSDVIDSVALGMYLLIVHRAAVARAQYSAYTDSMRRLQQCWGDESVAKLVVKAASYAVVAPYVMLAESFEQSVDIAVVCMRNYVVSSGHTVDAVVPARYRLLSPIRTMESTAQRILTVDSVLPDTTVLPDVVSAQRFLTMFENTLTPAQREAVQHQIDLDAKPEPVSVAPETPQQGDEDEQHSREEWDEEYADLQERLDAMTLPPINDAAYTFAERTNHDKVWEFFKESIMEYRAYNIDVGLHTIKNAVELCQATWAGEPIKSKIHERNVSADVGIKYIDCKDGVLDISPDESYACVIDPGTLKYYMTTIRGGVVTVPIRTVEKVFTMATLRIFNAFAIAKEAKKMLELDYVPKCTAELVDGVPGCGKTYNILQEFTEHDVILTAVKDTRDATLAELLAMDKFRGMDELLKKRVRTIDSAGLHSVPRARTMFADEGLMAHMGGVCMGMVRCRPKRLKAYGDSTQIRFIDRGSHLGNMHFQSLFYWTAISELNTTVRCPADAIWVSSRFYPAERRPRIKTISPVRRSIEFVLEPNPKSPVWSNVDAAWSVLSILRGDGADLVARDTKFSFGSASRADGREGAVKVYSVHEIQGRTRPLVRAVRMTPFNPDVVKSPPHMNVMFTRHTLKMQYVSCKGPADDECSRLALAAQRLTNEELDEFVLPCPEWLQKRTMERQQKYAAYL